MKPDYQKIAESLLGDGKSFNIRVNGGSMSPILRTGDTIYVEPVKTGQLSLGDIVLFKKGEDMVAHRLIGRKPDNGRQKSEVGAQRGCGPVFFTKGDAFLSPDSPVRGEDIIGRVYAVGKCGKVFDLRKGAFSGLDRLAYRLSPFTAVFYSVLRRIRGFDSGEEADPGQREEEVIISALQSGVLKKDTVDFGKLLKAARKNGVSQRLYAVLRKQRPDSRQEEDFLLELRRDYMTTAARNTMLYEEFKRVAGSLREKRVVMIVMKGAALAELAYQDIGARAMSDIDILVKKADLGKVDDALEKAGYRAAAELSLDNLPGGGNYLANRDYRSAAPGRPAFHMHWHIVNSSVPAPYASMVSMDEIWEEAAPVEVAGVPVLIMSPHHFLIHLCEHAMRVSHSAAKLVYQTDIAAFVSAHGGGLDWNRVVDTADRFGLDRFVYYVLAMCRLNIGLEMPGWALEKLRPEKRMVGEKSFFNITARGNGFPGLSYPVHLAMNKDFADKAAFIFRTLFPPSWVLAKKFSYSGRTRRPFLLYVERLREIAAQLFLLGMHRLKKPGTLLILSMLLFASASAAAAGEVEKNSTYTMREPGVPEYLIAAGDILEVRIWKGFEEKKYDAGVKANGFITVGFVDVKVGDLTLAQAEEALKKALQDYIREPRVEMLVKEYRGRTATLLGAVQTPAKQYALTGKTRLSQLVVTAGGFTKEADLENVRITSSDGKIKKVNLFRVMFEGDFANDVVIDGGDVVYVPIKPELEDRNVFIFGEVNSPGMHKLTPGMTLVQALGKAGGQKEEALIDEIRVIRGGLEKPQILATNVRAIFEEGDITKDIRLEKNDIVYVPRSKVGNWNAFISKIRPTLDLLILPFAGTQVVRDVIKGRQQ